MMGSVKAGYECIKAFSETDFTEDLKAIDVPVLVIHSEDDQIVPYADSAPLTVKLLKNGTLKTYKDLPHGLCPDPSRDRESGDTCLHSRGGSEGRPASGRCRACHGVNLKVRARSGGRTRTKCPYVASAQDQFLIWVAPFS